MRAQGFLPARTVAEVAEVTSRTVLNWIHGRLAKGKNVGGQWYVRPDSLGFLHPEKQARLKAEVAGGASAGVQRQREKHMPKKGTKAKKAASKTTKKAAPKKRKAKKAEAATA